MARRRAPVQGSSKEFGGRMKAAQERSPRQARPAGSPFGRVITHRYFVIYTLALGAMVAFGFWYLGSRPEGAAAELHSGFRLALLATAGIGLIGGALLGTVILS